MNRIGISLTSMMLLLSVSYSYVIEIPTNTIIVQQDWNNSGFWDENEEITFVNKEKIRYRIDDGDNGDTYDSSAFNNGIHCVNNRETVIRNTFQSANSNADIFFGLSGSGTNVIFQNKIVLGSSSSFCVKVVDSAHLVIGQDAFLDFVNDNSRYTRQVWCYSDGSGVFETDPHFIADQYGTENNGAVGSFRFSKAIFISHATHNLPLASFEECVDCPDDHPPVNGHLVFESDGPSEWIVRTNDQVYDAAIWCWTDVIINTEKNLTHTGVMLRMRSGGGAYSYNLGAAFQTLAENRTITKRGSAALIFDGEQAYKNGTILRIEEGSVVFKCDAAGGWFRGGKEQGAQTVQVEIGPHGRAEFRTDTVRIHSLSMADAAAVVVELGSIVNVVNSTIDGVLQVEMPHPALVDGDTIKIFDWQNAPDGEFTEIRCDFAALDVSRLYTDGVLILNQSSINQSSTTRFIPRKNASQTISIIPANDAFFDGTIHTPNGRLLKSKPVRSLFPLIYSDINKKSSE